MTTTGTSGTTEATGNPDRETNTTSNGGATSESDADSTGNSGTGAAGTTRSVLAVERLRRTFSGITAVDDVSFGVSAGQTVSIIGPNGSGKTTTINLLSGLLKPDSGSVFLNGRQIAGLPAHVIARRGARRTFQNGRVFADMSVEDNVFTGLYTSLASVRPFPRLRTVPVLKGISILGELLLALVRGGPSAADREQAEREIGRQVDRYGSRLTPRRKDLAYTLSYANRRRTEIARAMASGPLVLLLDEPTAGMNQTETAEVLRQLLELKAQGQTMVLVEHKMDLVNAVSDHVVVMDGGKIIAAGPPEEIRRDERVIEAYLGRRESARGAARAVTPRGEEG